MTIAIERRDHTIATITGRIDTLTATDLENKVLPLITDGKPSIEFNCDGVSYISSTGLRLFIKARNAAKNHSGVVIITGISSELRELFDIAGILDLFEFRY